MFFDLRPIPLAEIACKKGHTLDVLTRLAREGKVPGAVKFGGTWYYAPVKHLFELRGGGESDLEGRPSPRFPDFL
ncbi:MAG: hypothetical protein IH851_05580 [Armatimonadetes bacterium]|nr:hypothetical protein [Armatimonadota bacterium]